MRLASLAFLLATGCSGTLAKLCTLGGGYAYTWEETTNNLQCVDLGEWFGCSNTIKIEYHYEGCSE